MTNTPPTGVGPDPNQTQASTTATQDNTKAINDNKDAAKANTEQMQEYADKVDKSRALQTLFSGSLIATKTAWDGISGEVSKYMKNLDKSADMSVAAMSKFGAAVTTAFGVTKSTFGGANFSGINTFRGQLDELLEPIKNNKTALGQLADSFGVHLPSAVKGSAEQMEAFIKGAVGNLLDSADNAVKLQDVYIKAAAATGRLGDMQAAVGPNLEKMNQYIRDQRTAITQASLATNLSNATVEDYYNQLMKLPVAFKVGADGMRHAQNATAELTKTIQLARGLGREYADVLEDMRYAIRDYNASLPEAMEFTSQISQISKNYNVELKDVQSSLRATADAFKMFGNEGEGAAAILNEYVGSLKATGISGAVATDIVGNMTRQIGQLSIAQKAFLSAQQGGPGGLMGAYDIDMKLRQGKLQEVMDMAKNQLTKMTGPLVSLEEARNSPQAAAQMTKQIQMLRAGPLGQFARTDQEAERIIEAFKTGRTTDFKELVKGQAGVEDATKQGLKYAEQTATAVTTQVGLMRAAQGEASFANLNTLQAGFTARAGIDLGEENLPSVMARQGAIKGTMGEAARLSTRPANAVDFMDEYKDALKAVPEEMKSVVEGIGNIPGEGPNQQQGETLDEYRKRSDAAKEQAMTLQGPARQAELDRIAKERAATERAAALKTLASQAGASELALPSFLKPDQKTALGTSLITPGQALGSAAAANAARGPALPAGTAAHPGMHPNAGLALPHATTGGSASLGTINVHVEGYCINCKQAIEGQDQTFQFPAQKVRP